jgi:hypothetical protein
MHSGQTEAAPIAPVGGGRPRLVPAVNRSFVASASAATGMRGDGGEDDRTYARPIQIIAVR